MHQAFLEYVCLNHFLDVNDRALLAQVGEEVWDIERCDLLLSDLVNCWVSPANYGEFLHNLLTGPSDLSSPQERACRMLEAVGSWSKGLLEEVDGPDQEGALALALGHLEAGLEALMCLGEEGEGPGPSKAFPDELAAEAADKASKGLADAMDWLLYPKRGMVLRGQLVIRLPQEEEIEHVIDWGFNVPAMLLTMLSEDGAQGREAMTANAAPEIMRWGDVIARIIDAFDEYRHGVISKLESPWYPTKYFFDAIYVPEQEGDGPTGSKFRPAEALEEYRRIFDYDSSIEPLNVVDLSPVGQRWREMAERPSRGGRKKSHLARVVVQMEEMGLVEWTSTRKSGKVRITDLGRQAARDLPEKKLLSSPEMVNSGRMSHRPRDGSKEDEAHEGGKRG